MATQEEIRTNSITSNDTFDDDGVTYIEREYHYNEFEISKKKAKIQKLLQDITKLKGNISQLQNNKIDSNVLAEGYKTNKYFSNQDKKINNIIQEWTKYLSIKQKELSANQQQPNKIQKSSKKNNNTEKPQLTENIKEQEIKSLQQIINNTTELQKNYKEEVSKLFQHRKNLEVLKLKAAANSEISLNITKSNYSYKYPDINTQREQNAKYLLATGDNWASSHQIKKVNETIKFDLNCKNINLIEQATSTKQSIKTQIKKLHTIEQEFYICLLTNKLHTIEQQLEELEQQNQDHTTILSAIKLQYGKTYNAKSVKQQLKRSDEQKNSNEFYIRQNIFENGNYTLEPIVIRKELVQQNKDSSFIDKKDHIIYTQADTQDLSSESKLQNSVSYSYINKEPNTAPKAKGYTLVEARKSFSDHHQNKYEGNIKWHIAFLNWISNFCSKVWSAFFGSHDINNHDIENQLNYSNEELNKKLNNHDKTQNLTLSTQASSKIGSQNDQENNNSTGKFSDIAFEQKFIPTIISLNLSGWDNTNNQVSDYVEMTSDEKKNFFKKDDQPTIIKTTHYTNLSIFDDYDYVKQYAGTDTSYDNNWNPIKTLFVNQDDIISQ